MPEITLEEFITVVQKNPINFHYLTYLPIEYNRPWYKVEIDGQWFYGLRGEVRKKTTKHYKYNYDI